MYHRWEGGSVISASRFCVLFLLNTPVDQFWEKGHTALETQINEGRDGSPFFREIGEDMVLIPLPN